MNGGNQNNNRHDISIMSMNCRGLADAQKRRDVMHYLNKNPFKKGCDRSKEEIGCVVEMDLKNKESKTIICVLMVFY